MKENFFDPSEYIRNLQQLLVSDKKKIGFLFGAGTSISYVFGIAKITELVEKELEEEVNKERYKTAIEEIKTELGNKYTVETLLSN